MKKNSNPRPYQEKYSQSRKSHKSDLSRTGQVDAHGGRGGFDDGAFFAGGSQGPAADDGHLRPAVRRKRPGPAAADRARLPRLEYGRIPFSACPSVGGLELPHGPAGHAGLGGKFPLGQLASANQTQDNDFLGVGKHSGHQQGAVVRCFPREHATRSTAPPALPSAPGRVGGPERAGSAEGIKVRPGPSERKHGPTAGPVYNAGHVGSARPTPAGQEIPAAAAMGDRASSAPAVATNAIQGDSAGGPAQRIPAPFPPVEAPLTISAVAGRMAHGGLESDGRQGLKNPVQESQRCSIRPRAVVSVCVTKRRSA